MRAILYVLQLRVIKSHLAQLPEDALKGVATHEVAGVSASYMASQDFGQPTAHIVGNLMGLSC